MQGALTLEKLEAMTCVCSVGLDMIAIPGDTKASTIAGIIADESAIGMVNQKTTAVRLIPVIGKGVGEVVEFGGLLGYAPIMPVNQFSCDAFVARGGRIPAPIHSFKKLRLLDEFALRHSYITVLKYKSVKPMRKSSKSDVTFSHL